MSSDPPHGFITRSGVLSVSEFLKMENHNMPVLGGDCNVCISFCLLSRAWAQLTGRRISVRSKSLISSPTLISANQQKTLKTWWRSMAPRYLCNPTNGWVCCHDGNNNYMVATTALSNSSFWFSFCFVVTTYFSFPTLILSHVRHMLPWTHSLSCWPHEHNWLYHSGEEY